MKTHAKYLMAGLALVAALGGSFAVNTSSDSLQGSFPGSGATWALSATSPSGAASLSSDDEIFKFDITASSTKDVKLPDGTHLDFAFASKAGSIDPYPADGTQVYLRNSAGQVVGEGYMTANTSGEDPMGAWASVYITNSTWSPVKTLVSAGSTETFTLTVDSDSLVNETSGADDVTVTMTYKTISVAGNTLSY